MPLGLLPARRKKCSTLIESSGFTGFCEYFRKKQEQNNMFWAGLQEKRVGNGGMGIAVRGMRLAMGLLKESSLGNPIAYPEPRTEILLSKQSA
jgi:hypothetical protein